MASIFPEEPSRKAGLLFSATCVAGAACIFSIFVVVMVQVFVTVLDKVLVLLGGEPLGLFIPSYAEMTGFLRGASCWLALACTFQFGNHVRVTLLTHGLGGRSRRWVEAICLLIALALVAVLTQDMAVLTMESLEFGDRSYGMLGIPLWLPQGVMTLGLTVMALAIVYDLGLVLRGSEPTYGFGERRSHDAEDFISD